MSLGKRMDEQMSSKRTLVSDVGIIDMMLGYMSTLVVVQSRLAVTINMLLERMSLVKSMSTFVVVQSRMANDVGTIDCLLGYMSLVVVQSTLAKDVGTIVLLGYMSLVTQMPWPTTRDHHRADLLPLLIPKFQTTISTASTHSGSCFDVPNFAVYS